MTTNVFDKAAAIVASDSRWSYPITHAVIYVDDAPFEKIALDHCLAYVFAGCSGKIREWKEWIASPGRAVVNRPQVKGKGIALCIIDIDRNEVVFDRNQEISGPDAFFAGTGAYPAHSCWSKNKDPLKAVESAKLADRYSGGTVKFLRLATREHNLLVPESFDAIKQETLTRGMVMYFQNPPHIPLKEAAANDSEVAKAIEKLASGEASMTAPCPSAENEWTDEEIQRLDQALGAYYPPK